MQRRNPFTKVEAQRTSRIEAWRYGYETSRVNFRLWAIRLHKRRGHHFSPWYAADPIGMSAAQFQDAYSLPKEAGTEEMDVYWIMPDTIVNVGETGRFGNRKGGALQLEYVAGPRPYLVKCQKAPPNIKI